MFPLQVGDKDTHANGVYACGHCNWTEGRYGRIVCHILREHPDQDLSFSLKTKDMDGEAYRKCSDGGFELTNKPQNSSRSPSALTATPRDSPAPSLQSCSIPSQYFYSPNNSPSSSRHHHSPSYYNPSLNSPSPTSPTPTIPSQLPTHHNYSNLNSPQPPSYHSPSPRITPQPPHHHPPPVPLTPSNLPSSLSPPPPGVLSLISFFEGHPPSDKDKDLLLPKGAAREDPEKSVSGLGIVNLGLDLMEEENEKHPERYLKNYSPESVTPTDRLANQHSSVPKVCHSEKPVFVNGFDGDSEVDVIKPGNSSLGNNPGRPEELEDVRPSHWASNNKNSAWYSEHPPSNQHFNEPLDPSSNGFPDQFSDYSPSNHPAGLPTRYLSSNFLEKPIRLPTNLPSETFVPNRQPYDNWEIEQPPKHWPTENSTNQHFDEPSNYRSLNHKPKGEPSNNHSERPSHYPVHSLLNGFQEDRENKWPSNTWPLKERSIVKPSDLQIGQKFFDLPSDYDRPSNSSYTAPKYQNSDTDPFENQPDGVPSHSPSINSSNKNSHNPSNNCPSNQPSDLLAEENRDREWSVSPSPPHTPFSVDPLPNGTPCQWLGGSHSYTSDIPLNVY